MAASAPRWDGHAHIIGDPSRYPLAPGRAYEPPPASLGTYLAVLDRLELDRGVLVQPSVYGFDNRCMLDAIGEAGGRLVGVAVPAPQSEPRELEALAGRGVVGVRCNLLNPGGLNLETALGWQPVLRELGWHVAIHADVAELGDLARLLDDFDVPVVIDHMGRPTPGAADPASPALRSLVEAVRAGTCAVKLSAPYRLSSGPPPWRDVTPLARALLTADASACLWATDWPHTQMREGIRMEDLLAALEDWCPDPERRRGLIAREGAVPVH